MSVPYTDNEASEARQWSNRYGPPNAWTASFGTAARMIGRLLDERERLMAKQTVAAPGDDYIREWHEEFQRWKAVAEEKQDFRDHFAAAALTGLLAQGDDGSFSEESYVRGAYRWADAMLRERAKTNLDAAPEATANAESVAPQPTAGDRAGNPPSHSGTGDTPDSPKPINDCVSDRSKPINGPDPDSRVWETPVHTPAPHATPGEGSVPRDGTEPVAWGVAGHKGLLYATAISRMDAVDMQSEHECDTEVVPLYRHPPVTEHARSGASHD